MKKMILAGVAVVVAVLVVLFGGQVTSRLQRLVTIDKGWPLYTVACDGAFVNVHEARVSAVPLNREWPGHQRSLDQTEMASFVSVEKGEKPVVFEVGVLGREIETVDIRPAEFGIVPEVDKIARRIKFTVEKPCQFSVLVNGKHSPLHVFVDGPEPYRVGPDDPDTVYFGPGEHDAGLIVLKSGQTLYVHRDAVVYGAVTARDAENVRVLGRGIIDGSRDTCRCDRAANNFDASLSQRVADSYRANFPDMNDEDISINGLMVFRNCRNVLVEGVTLRDSFFWTLTTRNGCEDVEIANVKIVGQWRHNSDGIDICTSRRVRVHDSFIRSFDDAVVVRLPALEGERGEGMGERFPCLDTLVEDCVIWCDWGIALETWLAYQTGSTARNTVFRRIYVTHLDWAVCDIQYWHVKGNTGGCRVSDVLFEDIFIDTDGELPFKQYQRNDSETYLCAGGAVQNEHLLLNIATAGVTPGMTLGNTVENVTLRGIHFRGPRLGVRVLPVPGAFDIKNLSIEPY